MTQLDLFQGEAVFDAANDSFFLAPADPQFLYGAGWRTLAYAYKVKRRREGTYWCDCDHRTPSQHGIALHVDHIKPRKLFPELAYEVANLQLLCEDCNRGKGNWDQTDWREVA